MKEILIFLLTTMLAFASAASGAEIDTLAWNQSNLKTLGAFDEAAVLRFLDSLLDSTPSIDSVAGDIEEHTIQTPEPESADSSLSDSGSFEFDWHQAGDGKYELAVSSSTGPEIAYLTIYWKEASHKVRSQAFDMPPYETGPPSGGNWYYGTGFADLNANGIDELILFAPIDQSPGLLNRKFVPNGAWPQVYRLRDSDGPYVEASGEFSAFYVHEFLPPLDNEIVKVRKPHSDTRDPEALILDARYLAALMMCRDKILRFLGRDPVAGLTEARGWMSSPDPVLVDDARIVFEDMGGHHDEAVAATLATQRALEHWPDRSLLPSAHHARRIGSAPR